MADRADVGRMRLLFDGATAGRSEHAAPRSTGSDPAPQSGDGTSLRCLASGNRTYRYVDIAQICPAGRTNEKIVLPVFSGVQIGGERGAGQIFEPRPLGLWQVRREPCPNDRHVRRAFLVKAERLGAAWQRAHML